jgi:prevent-host-death family protein
MQFVDMTETTMPLSSILALVEKGESVVLAQSGKPVAKVVPYAPDARNRKKRLGFLQGQLDETAMIKDVGQAEIADMFGIPK